MIRKTATLRKRITLTLPADSALQAQKIANLRRTNLSTVISEVVAAGLEIEAAGLRRSEILVNYRNAFSGFSPDELAILDGVILERALSRR